MAVRSVTSPIPLAPPWLGVNWKALVQALAYPVAEKRDLRIDLLRGFCVFAMVVDHIGGESFLYALTGGNRWLVSAAEGFVFLSGLTMGLVYREKIRRAGLRAAAQSALQRAGTLYLLTVVLTLIFTALARLTNLSLWTDRALASGELPELVIGALTLHYTFHGTDILALYTILVAAAPLLFYLLDERRTTWVMAGSWLMWVGYQLFPEQFAFPWSIRNSNYFPLAAWQVLFVGGMVIGWHRKLVSELVKERMRLLRQAPVVLSLVSPTLAMGSVGWIDRGQLAASGFDPMVGLFAKPNLGPGRLLLFLAMFLATYLLLTVAWRPIERATGWLLLPLGQTTLYGYTMQLFMVVVIYNLMLLDFEAAQATLRNTLVQAAAIALLLAMVKAKFLFRLVPR
jgi:hypothetical protein